jgi:outer membrane immunogenic protein
MNRVVFGLATIIALSTTGAIAADVVVRPKPPAAVPVKVVAPPTWQGFYAGLNAGYAWDRVRVHNFDEDFSEAPAEFFTNNGHGFVGGGQFGFNLQHGALVFGPEFDLDWSAAKGSATLGDITSNWSAGFLGDATVRIGVAHGPVLFYLKGGYAYSHGTVRIADLGEPPIGSKTALSGWTLGGGVELMHSANWSVKGEYQYFDFGKTRMLVSGEPDRYDNTVTGQTLKIGFNYRFH